MSTPPIQSTFAGANNSWAFTRPSSKHKAKTSDIETIRDHLFDPDKLSDDSIKADASHLLELVGVDRNLLFRFIRLFYARLPKETLLELYLKAADCVKTPLEQAWI